MISASIFREYDIRGIVGEEGTFRGLKRSEKLSRGG